MPIRDLTERPQIPRLGKIRLGEKDPQRGFPVNRPYFLVPPEVADVYGEKPTELKIVFLSDDEEAIVSQYLRAYNASNGRICRGDGFRADASLDADELTKRGGDLTAPLPLECWAHGATGGKQATKEVVRHEIECLGPGYDGQPACPMYAHKGCKGVMFMQFAVYGVRGIGVYQLDTGSIVGMSKVNGTIKMIKALTGGRIAGIPLTLRRVEAEVAPDGKKKKVWIVELSAEGLTTTAMLAAAGRPAGQALLPPPDESDAPFDDETPALPEPGNGKRAEAVEAVVNAPPPEPEPAPQTPTPQTPIDLINAIGKAHGPEAMRTARALSRKLYGKDLLALNDAERADYRDVLRFRLAGQAHGHELSYTATGDPVCRLCGEPVDPRVLEEAALPVQ